MSNAGIRTFDKQTRIGVSGDIIIRMRSEFYKSIKELICKNKIKINMENGVISGDTFPIKEGIKYYFGAKWNAELKLWEIGLEEKYQSNIMDCFGSYTDNYCVIEIEKNIKRKKEEVKALHVYMKELENKLNQGITVIDESTEWWEVPAVNVKERIKDIEIQIKDIEKEISVL